MAHWYPQLTVPPASPASQSGNWQAFIQGAWDQLTRDFWAVYPQKMIGTTPNTLNRTATLAATPSPYRWHWFNLVSPPLKAQTISGTLDLLMGVCTQVGTPLFSWRIVVWTSDGMTGPRGIILDYTEAAGHELPVSATGATTAWGLSAPQTLTPVTVNNGDFLIIEVGVIARAPTATSQRFYYSLAPVTGEAPSGVVNPDLLAPGSTLTMTRAGWVDFSNPPLAIDPPANDACASPIVIASLPYQDAMGIDVRQGSYDPATDLQSSCRTGGASFNPGEGLYNTIWYRWTAPSSGPAGTYLRADTQDPVAWPPPAPGSGLQRWSGGDTTLTTYTGSCGALTEVSCGVGYNGGGAMNLFPVVWGTTYYFRIGWRFLNDGSHMAFKARLVTRPVNDDLANATVLGALPFTDVSDTTLATRETGEPGSMNGWTGDPVNCSVWYKWVADPAPGNVRVSTYGSDYQSQVTVWQRVPASTFPLPPSTNLYDTFNRPDAATLGANWGVAAFWSGVGLRLQNQGAASPGLPARCAGSYWNEGRYGPDCEFFCFLHGEPGLDQDEWAELDMLTSSNPSGGSENGFWVATTRNTAAGYHAQLGRYTAGVGLTLATSNSPVPITGIGFRRLGSTLQMWVQRAGAWTVEASVTDTNYLVTLGLQIGVCTTTPGTLTIDTVGGGTIRAWQGDLWVEVFSAPWTNTLDEAGFYDQANMVFRPTPGVTYYIAVISDRPLVSYDNRAGGGHLQLSISRVTAGPPNYSCATALALSRPHYAAYSNVDAADGQMEVVPLGACDWYTMEGNDSGKVLWFKWTADITARVNFNTHGSQDDVPLEVVVYTGSCGALVPIDCGDYNWTHGASQFLIDAIAGTTYYFRLTASGRMEGSFRLFLDVDWTEFQDGDVLVSSFYVWLFASNGALRRFESFVLGPPYQDVPTGSGIDPVTGVAYIAQWQVDNILRVDPLLTRPGTRFPTAPGDTPEVPAFAQDGKLYVGFWGNWQLLEGIDGLVDPTFAIRRFDAPSGTLVQTYAAKQERDGTAWMDLLADQATILYTSRGRKIMAYDVAADAQLPDIVQLTDPYPTYRLRGIRERPNGELLVADAAEVKRLSAAGTVLQRYPIDARDDLNVLDQDATSTVMWVGDQDSGEFYKVDIATGAVLLKVPGGPFFGMGWLCGLSVVGGYRAGTTVPSDAPPCISGVFAIDTGPPTLPDP